MAIFSAFVGRHVCPWLTRRQHKILFDNSLRLQPQTFFSSPDLARKIVNKTPREHDLTRVDVLRERHVELTRIVFGKDSE